MLLEEEKEPPASRPQQPASSSSRRRSRRWWWAAWRRTACSRRAQQQKQHRCLGGFVRPALSSLLLLLVPPPALPSCSSADRCRSFTRRSSLLCRPLPPRLFHPLLIPRESAPCHHAHGFAARSPPPFRFYLHSKRVCFPFGAGTPLSCDLIKATRLLGTSALKVVTGNARCCRAVVKNTEASSETGLLASPRTACTTSVTAAPSSVKRVWRPEGSGTPARPTGPSCAARGRKTHGTRHQRAVSNECSSQRFQAPWVLWSKTNMVPHHGRRRSLRPLPLVLVPVRVSLPVAVDARLRPRGAQRRRLAGRRPRGVVPPPARERGGGGADLGLDHLL